MAKSVRKVAASLPPAVFASRLQASRHNIQKQALDGYLVLNPFEQFYFTGFDGEDGATLILGRQVYVITDGRFTEQLGRSAPWARPAVRTGALSAALGELIRKHRLRKVGFRSEHMTVAALNAFRKAVRPTRLVPAPKVTAELRECKDASEVAAIEQAVEIAQTAFSKLKTRIRVGMTESEIAAELDYHMVRLGAQEPGFPTIVAVDANSSLPHARPGSRKVRDGSAILIDWGARVGGYCSDLTRMLYIRRIPPRFRRMHDAVLAAQQAAISAIVPGAVLGEIYGAGRGRLAEAGMAEQFTHGLGHGLGLEVHEPPRLGPKIRDKCRTGMVVTVEPGVYFPGVGGVRIEDDVLVTDTGCRVLSNLPREPQAAIIPGGRRSS